MSFAPLGLNDALLESLAYNQLQEPTPIQAEAIPQVLVGRDILGLAQTGTGKTAAFVLPLIHRLMETRPKRHSGQVRAIIIAPTRELVTQIHQVVRDFAYKKDIYSTTIVGGVSIHGQKKQLARGQDLIVATPGRLEDLLKQKAITMKAVEMVVLDEADQMMDIGFLPAIRRLLGTMPATRQTLLFSATMPKDIRQLVDEHLNEPVEVAVAPVAATADRIEQKIRYVPGRAKQRALEEVLEPYRDQQAIVFVRTKHGADRLARALKDADFETVTIHGNRSQGQRQHALMLFRKGEANILVATDVAARGIDVPNVALVVNYDVPTIPESYVHRIGRTARAGAEGVAVSLCTAGDKAAVRDIEKLIGMSIEVEGEVPHMADVEKPKKRGRQRPKHKGAPRVNGQGGREDKGDAARKKTDRPKRREDRAANKKPHRKGTRDEKAVSEKAFGRSKGDQKQKDRTRNTKPDRVKPRRQTEDRRARRQKNDYRPEDADQFVANQDRGPADENKDQRTGRSKAQSPKPGKKRQSNRGPKPDGSKAPQKNKGGRQGKPVGQKKRRYGKSNPNAGLAPRKRPQSN